MQHLQEILQLKRPYLGCRYLVYTLSLALENEDYLFFLERSAFPAVADQFHTKTHCIERNIRTVIDQCWMPECRAGLQSICPIPLTQKPTVSEFIDILYLYYVRKKSAVKNSNPII